VGKKDWTRVSVGRCRMSGTECCGLGTSRKSKRQESGARSQKAGSKQKVGKPGIDDGDRQTSPDTTFGPVMLSPPRRTRHPGSLWLDAERKRQLHRSFARPKARRAQDDRRVQIRNSGSTDHGSAMAGPPTTSLSSRPRAGNFRFRFSNFEFPVSILVSRHAAPHRGAGAPPGRYSTSTWRWSTAPHPPAPAYKRSPFPSRLQAARPPPGRNL